jgi:hypothetical protein
LEAVHEIVTEIEESGSSFPASGLSERRAKQRFGIQQELYYKVLYGKRIAETGAGCAINVSSNGIWFTTEDLLPSGMPVEVSMIWPVLLNATCPLKLVLQGCVIRSDDRSAAVAIESYEFRTRSRFS